MWYGDVIEEQKQLEHQLQGYPDVEVGDRLHRHPHVVVSAAVHIRPGIVAIATYTVTSDLRIHVHSGGLKVVDVVVQEAVRCNFHDSDLHFPWSQLLSVESPTVNSTILMAIGTPCHDSQLSRPAHEVPVSVCHR